MTKAKIDRAAQVAKWSEQAAAEWFDKHGSEAQVKYDVTKLLDSKREEIVANLLGFKIDWREWQVDNCNGRSGESAAGDLLRKTAGKAVDEWLLAQAGALPTLPKGAAKAFLREYAEALEDALRDRARSMAEEEAERITVAAAHEAAGLPAPSGEESR